MNKGYVTAGSGVEEKPFPISRVPTKLPAAGGEHAHSALVMDFYTQARKALGDRSPFGSEDVINSTVPTTLPSALAGFLFKLSSDSRKRHKKSHLGSGAGGETKKKSSKPEKPPSGANIWPTTEEYFRNLNPDDIDRLHGASCFKPLTSHDFFLIPDAGNGTAENEGRTQAGILEDTTDDGFAIAKEEEDEPVHLMEVDEDHIGRGGSADASAAPDELSSQPECSNGIEWLLGSRDKIYLTSERPSKKRKLLGGEAGLEKVFVASPVEGNSDSLCHYCSQGDTGNQLNRLIVCSSCGMAVHQRCYGVQDYDKASSWLCSWCKNGGKCIDKPCLLCSRQGGALKPIDKRGAGSDRDSSLEFSHLFCAQWMPEVYIEDIKSMEPIMNIEGIKDTRRKLICNLCKVKCGACVRCSHGACRTSFHPICAREARHRMEIWGKFSQKDVELRAFCSNHSKLQNNINQQVENVSVAVGSDSSVTEHEQLLCSVSKPHKLRISRINGDKFSLHMETTQLETDKVGGCLSPENDLLNTRSSAEQRLGLDSDCALQPLNGDLVEKNSTDDVKVPESLNYTLVLKKLIDTGKIDLKDVASDVGVTADILASNLTDDCLLPDLRGKLMKWVRNYSHVGTLQKNLKVKIKSAVVSKTEMGVTVDKFPNTLSEFDVPDVLSVKSIPPRRRTKSSIRKLRYKKLTNSFNGKIGGDGTVMDEDSGHFIHVDQSTEYKELLPDKTEKVPVEPSEGSDALASNSFEHKVNLAKCMKHSLSGSDQSEETFIKEQNTTGNFNLEKDDHPVAMDNSLDAINGEALAGPYIHPLISKKFSLVQSQILSPSGSRNREVFPPEASSSSGICCDYQIKNSSCSDPVPKANILLLVEANNLSISDLSPIDEVEGELIYHQHKLLCNAVLKRKLTDDLICSVVNGLPKEIDKVRQRNWDAVLVNRYLCELREAKKQGRKERRHKEAQAVLAAATAAAAASSRISSFRKDMVEESAGQEEMPRAKEALPKSAVARVSTEMKSGSSQSTIYVCKEHPRTCDICRRMETILNPIVICSNCKVTVHMDCYRAVKDSVGPWYCELCDDLLSSRSRGAPALNTWEKLSHVECGLCGNTTGAFRKSTNGQWVHAFCAEWVLEATFRRGQVNPVQSMESVSKGNDNCFLCSRKQGLCVKCNYGHCQSTFHASCGRSAGLYMNVRTVGGKLQHKAYCEKHSLVERAKAETQKHGTEEWNCLKKVRVELERLRLICERIIKREKMKRELVICSQDILGSNRDSVASSIWACSSYFSPDVSSESATTSLKGYMDAYKSGREVGQRSDDITVDSTIAGKWRIKFPVSMDNDRKTDDSSTSQLFTQNPSGRTSFSGKQMPQRPSAATSRSTLDDEERRSRYRKHTETFEKELMMTSDQASMRNRRLPKGFVYVPVGSLSNEKGTVANASSSQEQSDHDG